MVRLENNLGLLGLGFRCQERLAAAGPAVWPGIEVPGDVAAGANRQEKLT